MTRVLCPSGVDSGGARADATGSATGERSVGRTGTFGSSTSSSPTSSRSRAGMRVVAPSTCSLSFAVARDVLFDWGVFPGVTSRKALRFRGLICVACKARLLKMGNAEAAA